MGEMTTRLTRLASSGRAAVLAPALGLVAVLMTVGGRYGLHRDEWYFVEAGHHPAAAYPDQPALAPIAASLWYGVVHGNVWAFRLAPALVAALVVALAVCTCHQLGGDRRAQVATAAATATCSTLLATGHLFSTTVVDIAVTTAAVAALIRAVRTGSARDWLTWGALVGLALNVKLLPAVVMTCCLLALVLAGPRDWLRSRWPYLGGVLALALAAPVLVWQASNGWPQLQVAAGIAAGGSGTSAERWLVAPLQLTTTGPLTFWILVVGLVTGWRGRTHRWLVVAAGLLLGVVIVTGGKPYYTMGLVPALLALAGPAVASWSGQKPSGQKPSGQEPVGQKPSGQKSSGQNRSRLTAVAALTVGNLVGGALVTLPLLPISTVNVLRPASYDLAEQIGWPHLVDVVQAAQLSAVDPSSTVIITSNYGEAGALSAARRAGRPLVAVYSGHNAFGLWGPPPQTTTAVLWVGPAVDPARDDALASTCRALAPVGTPGIENDESDAVVSLCALDDTRDWQVRWRRISHLG
jgi:4-amino-4-deoxy-L-arabinose transferase-like glycosyltransferase